MDVWPLAAANFAALSGIRTRSVSIGDFTFKIQFNPARAVSSGARTDAASIARRLCFLCRDHRPEEQTWVDAGEFEILVNPFPIFPHHYTIAHREHRRQAIDGYWCHIAALAYQLDGYTVFYNGPRCGASAPDHFHFQAVPSEFLPIWDHAVTPDCGIGIPSDMPFGMVAIITDSFTRLSELACGVMSSLPISHDEYEPKVNILCRHDGTNTVLIIIPRKAHRPGIYPRRMISPASIDLAGVFITPVLDDFEAMDAATISGVINEVCYSADEVKRLISLT